jgi:hypothetical protein
MVLSVLLAPFATAAVILAVIYSIEKSESGAAVPEARFAARPSPNDGAHQDPQTHAVASHERLVQTGEFECEGQFGGIVYYPVPFGSPPHLTVKSPAFQVALSKQDELGFSWTKGSVLAAIQSEVNTQKSQDSDAKPSLQPQELTWEAKGVRAPPESLKMIPGTQTGKFFSIAGETGEIYFPVPFASPPNIEFDRGMAGSSTTIVVKCTATGFRWKNAAPKGNAFGSEGELTWNAKGIKATSIPKHAGMLDADTTPAGQAK